MTLDDEDQFHEISVVVGVFLCRRWIVARGWLCRGSHGRALGQRPALGILNRQAQIPQLLLEDPRSELVFRVDQQRMREFDLAPFLKRFGVLELKRLRIDKNGDIDDKAAVRSVKWSAGPPGR